MKFPIHRPRRTGGILKRDRALRPARGRASSSSPARPAAAAVALALTVLWPPANAEQGQAGIPGSDVSGVIGDGGLDIDGRAVLQQEKGRWRDDLVIAPVPGRSPQFGWSLAVGAGYFFGDDENEEQKPSIVGGLGWYAENGSYAYGVGGNLHLRDDDLRVRFGAAYMDVKYRYYGIGDAENDLGISVNILQEAPMAFASVSWRLWNRLYLGLGYLGGTVDSRAELELDGPSSFFDPVLSLDIGAVTVPVEFDSRDHEQFPRSGTLVKSAFRLFRKDAGGDFDAETFTLSMNKYIPVRDRDVVALRGYFNSASGDAPFFLLSTFGGGTDLRGYPSGRYRDRVMYAVQGEYRWQFSDRWVFSGFAGFGEVAPDVGEFGDDLLPAAGLGARMVLSKKHKVSLSFDVAQGRDGTEYYFGVGEAF